MSGKAVEKARVARERKVLSARVDEEILKRFRHYCVDEGLSGPEVLTRWIKAKCPPRPAEKEAVPCGSD
jgi:hypothetical protein